MTRVLGSVTRVLGIILGGSVDSQKQLGLHKPCHRHTPPITGPRASLARFTHLPTYFYPHLGIRIHPFTPIYPHEPVESSFIPHTVG